MFNSYRTVLILFLAALLGVCFVFVGIPSSEQYQILDPLGAFVREETAKVAISPDTSEKGSEAGGVYRRVGRILKNPAVEQAGRIILIGAALEEGSAESLSLLKPAVLKELPDYERTIWPAVRKHSLDIIVRKLTEDDWNNWLELRQGFSTRLSPAEAYLEKIYLNNKELALYLDTAVILLSNMQRRISAGHRFDLEAEIKSLVENAPRLLGKKKRLDESFATLVDSSVTSDAFFLELIERKRAVFVATLLKRQPYNAADNLLHVASLAPKYCGDEVLLGIADFLLNIATGVGKEVRFNFLKQEVTSRIIQTFSATNDRVKRALAQAYLMGAIDALEDGVPSYALDFFREAITQDPYVSGREAIRSLLIERFPETVTGVLISAKERSLLAINTTAFDAEDSEPEEDSSGVFGWLVLLVLAVGGGYGIVAAKRTFNSLAAQLDQPVQQWTREENKTLRPKFGIPKDDLKEVLGH
ncbi:MAG: hypothetical protein IT291_10615 [Deltaproteobacteria bacterium]|nr:hypothetical protein [Deltaproteobacteria bacterium]